VSKFNLSTVWSSAQATPDPDVSALIAERMTAAELADILAVIKGGPRADRILHENTRGERWRQFIYRVWLARRVLAQIDWDQAVIRNDVRRGSDDDDYTTEPFEPKKKPPEPPPRSTLSAKRVDEDDKVVPFGPKKTPPDEEPEDEEAEPEPEAKSKRRLPVTDFVAFSPDHTYINRSTGESWTSTAVNSRVLPIKIGGGKKPLAANTWLDRNDAVEQQVWAPGEPPIIENKLVAAGGFFAKKGARVFNLYKPPEIVRSRNDDVSFWQGHLQELWPPDQADHIERWFAHRAQRPGDKINHSLVLGGVPGIGKDAIIEPLRRAVGAWNFADISPQAVLGNFNEFARSVVLRVSEGKDLGEFDRFAFYEATKTLMAAPPDTLRCNPKFVKPYYVLNVTGVIITTNHKVGGLFLPADDRRHFVAWSTREMTDYSPAYWEKYWARMKAGGADAVAKHLRSLDLDGFDPKTPPPRTQAFLEMVDAMRSEEESDMADAIDSLGNPKALMVADLIGNAETFQRFRFAEFLKDPAKRRSVVIRLEGCGYRRLDNPDDSRGRWKIGGQRGSVYVLRQLTDREGFAAIRDRGGV
jgi:hypothetical protein